MEKGLFTILTSSYFEASIKFYSFYEVLSYILTKTVLCLFFVIIINIMFKYNIIISSTSTLVIIKVSSLFLKFLIFSAFYETGSLLSTRFKSVIVIVCTVDSKILQLPYFGGFNNEFTDNILYNCRNVDALGCSMGPVAALPYQTIAMKILFNT